MAAHGVSVAFEHVGFTWDPARGPALEDVSFRVPAGETLVLVGPSGAGKSTVIELLLGFVQPQSGRVLINGADLATVVPEALTRMTAAIGQRPVLFAGTIRDNIRFARPDATERGAGRGRPPAPRVPRSPTRCRTGWTRWSARAATACRAARRNAWRSPAPS